MNTEFYNLDYPVEQVIKNIIVKFSINDIVVTPFQSANIFVNLYNVRNECVLTSIFLMEGQEYSNWSDDDEYLINWVKNKISNLF